MSNPLQIIGVSPVVLVASLDTSGNLLFTHGSNALEDYGDAIDILNDNLPVTVEILDFVHNNTTWQVSASHSSGGGTVTWTRGSSSCSHAWSATANQVEVTVVAEASPQSTDKPILIKVRPRTEQ
jgi:hypothetical protein